MSAPSATTTGRQWPADVSNFAAQHQLEDYLDPLLAAIVEIFPTALNVQVQLQHDPEIRDLSHIAFEVQVPLAEVPDPVAAHRAWHRQLFNICPAPLVSNFSLALFPIVP